MMAPPWTPSWSHLTVSVFMFDIINNPEVPEFPIFGDPRNKSNALYLAGENICELITSWQTLSTCTKRMRDRLLHLGKMYLSFHREDKEGQGM